MRAPKTVLLMLAWSAVGAVGAVVLTVEVARAQSSPPPAEPSVPAAGSAVDEILEEDEEVQEGAGVTYDPGTRRDPFKSLLVAPDQLVTRGPRPEGIPGLLIDEVELTGIFETPRGFVAQVRTSKAEKGYLIKEGDQLYDGEVVSITRAEVAFKQIVQDPTALKPYREVVKKLYP